MEVFCIHIPGRESRFREASIPDVVRLAEAVANAIEPYASQPFALFGHSLGGLVAFEIARALRRRSLPLPVRLFVSACRAAHLPNPYAPLRDLDDVDMLRRLNERYCGSVPPEVLESAELRDLLVPGLRGDLTALETYQHEVQPALDCAITAFGGNEDRTVPLEALEAWSVHTSTEFRLRHVSGGHFYLQSARQQLVDHICADVSASRTLQSATGVA
jgi:medium-chain acyl-[acyl-carrier-protein] hydrolase